jgi:hypothetical protein
VKKDFSLDLKRAATLPNYQKKPADLKMSQKVTLNQSSRVKILQYIHNQFPIKELEIATLKQ